MQIDCRIRRIVRIERKRPAGNVEPAERQCRFDTFHVHHTLQTRLKAGPRQFQISRRFASGQIPTNQHRIFGFDRDIKFPVAERRGWQRKKFGTFGRRLRRRSARQADGEKINVLQKPGVCQCDIAADCRRRKWSRYPDISISARGERIVSRNQHALSSHLQIESRFGQFNERNSPAHSKRPTSQIASEAIESERVVPKSDTCIKTIQRGKSRIRETGGVHRYIPCSTQNRMTKRSAHINVQAQIAIQLPKLRDKLPDEIYRAARDASFCSDRRVVGKSPSLDNFRHVERHAGADFQRLNPRLLQLA